MSDSWSEKIQKARLFTVYNPLSGGSIELEMNSLNNLKVVGDYIESVNQLESIELRLKTLKIAVLKLDKYITELSKIVKPNFKEEIALELWNYSLNTLLEEIKIIEQLENKNQDFENLRQKKIKEQLKSTLNEKRLLTQKEASEYLGLKDQTLIKYRKEGKLKCIIIGRNVKYEFKHLEEFIQNRTVN